MSFPLAGMSITLRSYAPQDVREVVSLFYGSVHGAAAGDYTPIQLDAWVPRGIDAELWCTSFLESYSITAIPKSGCIVGFGNLFKNGYLDLLYVYKDFQRRGIAALIAKNLERHAKGLKLGFVFTDASITERGFFAARRYRLYTEITGIKERYLPYQLSYGALFSRKSSVFLSSDIDCCR